MQRLRGTPGITWEMFKHTPRPCVALSFVRLPRLERLPACRSRYLDLPESRAFHRKCPPNWLVPELAMSFLPVTLDDRFSCCASDVASWQIERVRDFHFSRARARNVDGESARWSSSDDDRSRSARLSRLDPRRSNRHGVNTPQRWRKVDATDYSLDQ